MKPFLSFRSVACSSISFWIFVLIKVTSPGGIELQEALLPDWLEEDEGGGPPEELLLDEGGGPLLLEDGGGKPLEDDEGGKPLEELLEGGGKPLDEELEDAIDE